MIHQLLATCIRLITGIPPQAPDSLPKEAAIYFINHSSHLDFLAIWACLPADIRRQTHPVAAQGYWKKNKLRQWLALSVFRAHLINRKQPGKAGDPLEPLSKWIKQGHSIILFPEGTRSRDGLIKPFKPGLYHLAKRHPNTPLVPVHLDNMNRILPAGERLPVPLLGRVDFRPVIHLHKGEDKISFLKRARAQVLEDAAFTPSQTTK